MKMYLTAGNSDNRELSLASGHVGRDRCSSPVNLQYTSVNEVDSHNKQDHKYQVLPSETVAKLSSGGNSMPDQLSIQESCLPQALSIHSDAGSAPVAAAGKVSCLPSCFC